MTAIVIGVDPGESAGMAVLAPDPMAFGQVALVNVFQGTAGDVVTAVEIALTRYNTNGNDVTIACERYVNMQTRRGATHQPTAQRMIGTLDHLATDAEVRFVLQGPADAWAVAPNAMLRKLKMYQTKDTVDRPDANDANMAIRHALTYMMRAHTTLFDALLRRYGVGST